MLKTLLYATNPRCITNAYCNQAKPTVTITNGGRILDQPQRRVLIQVTGLVSTAVFCFVSFFVDSRRTTNTPIFPALYFYASAQGYSAAKYKCDKHT